MDASITRFAITVRTASYLMVATAALVALVCRAGEARAPVPQPDHEPVVIPEIAVQAESHAITNLAIRGAGHGSMPNLARLRFVCADDDQRSSSDVIVIADCPAPLRLRLQLAPALDHDQLGTFESEHRWLIVAAVGRSLAVRTRTQVCTGRERTIRELHLACLDADRQRVVQRRVFFDEAQRRWRAR
jgi:hypothetical protein